MKSFKLAIDGPAASGKSTISKSLAHKLGWNYVNTGIMFRIITFYLIQKQINWLYINDDNYLYPLLQHCNIFYVNNKFYFNNQDIELILKQEQLAIEKKISLVASLFLVRNKLLYLQQEIIKNHNYLIMDGRDIGTVVMPEADLKIFLIALQEVRILRRQNELKNIYNKKQLNKIMEDIKDRDQQDIDRKINPLKKSDDAISLDTTKLSVSETIKKIYDLIQKKW